MLCAFTSSIFPETLHRREMGLRGVERFAQPEVSQLVSDGHCWNLNTFLTLKPHNTDGIRTQPKFRLGLEPVNWDLNPLTVF